MKPDVILTWPSGLDYPICRWYLSQNRKKFNKIFVTFYKHGCLDFSDFIMKNWQGVDFLVSKTTNENWREDAVNIALAQSKSEWVWFTEQDFLFKDDYCFEKIQEAMKKYDVIGVRQGNRIHPMCIFAKRSVIDKTDCDFGTGEKHLDHFSKVVKQWDKFAKIGYLEDLGLFEGRDWYHMSSMTWNYLRIIDNDIKDIHEASNFLIWNAYNRAAKVPQSPIFQGLAARAEALLTTFGAFLHPQS